MVSKKMKHTNRKVREIMSDIDSLVNDSVDKLTDMITEDATSGTAKRMLEAYTRKVFSEKSHTFVDV